MSDDMHIARTILSQLGGNRFIAMTGVKTIINEHNGLMCIFSSKNTKDRGTHFKITLNGNDLYDLEYYKIVMKKDKDISYWIPTLEIIKESKNIDVNNLRETFTSMTGLYTHL